MSARAVGALALVALCSAASTGFAQQKPPATKPRTLAEDFQLFSQVLNQIRVNHPDSVDLHAMVMASIEGMVRAADPHSFVIPAVRLDSARQRALEEGKLAPVPIAWVFDNGGAFVVSVAPGSDASRRNILVGDELVAMDGNALTAESDEELSIALAGSKGSTVALRLRRRRIDGSMVTLERVVKRERVSESTAVPIAYMLDSATGYARVTTFENDKVADDLHDALGRLEKGGMKRLVLDLRDNGGGLVDRSAEAAGEFLPKGALIYSAVGRKEVINKTVKVPRSFWRSERSYPIVVMVNRGTASASELFAGALQDHDRALIVGRQTFGKALLMQGMPLTDGSLMLLVVGHVKTPCGRVVQRQYRGLRSRDYWREDEAAADTAGRPSCRTTSGRTVYGGGGIRPDIVLDQPPAAPVWLESLREHGVAVRWAAAKAVDTVAAPASVDRYVDGSVITADVVAQFRAYARELGTVVTDSASDDVLRRELAAELARSRLGDAAYYRVRLASDPWLLRAIASFGQATLLKGP